MRAVISDTLGAPEGYHLKELPKPSPGPGELQVQIAYSGMGYVDALIARGLYQVKPEPPYCPGLEYAGTVTELGAGADGFTVGDRVAVSAFGGGLAEFGTVPVNNAIKLPADFDLAIGASFIVNYVTAWHALLDRGSLKAGETLLVLGAAGGTGSAAIKVGRLCGARVIAGASTAKKRAYALAQGAHETIDYTEPEWRKTLKAMTQGRGIDVCFDPVGGDLLEPAFRSLGWRGRYLVIGFAGGAIPALPANLALLKGSALIGVDYRQFGSVFEPAEALAIRDQLFAAVSRGDLEPTIGTCFEFEDYRAAMALAGDRDGLGKTLVRISG